MSLEDYLKKRDFEKTPEPRSGAKRRKKTFIFVIQKHRATTLHYDFRLEIKGVLKSWAVPKEPTLNSKVKRLAIMTDDHPVSYADFEGVIPEGNYGAGTVEIWDKGNFLSIKGDDKSLLADLENGHLSFVLNGKKLKGEFALVKLKSANNAWLLIKAKDRYAQD